MNAFLESLKRLKIKNKSNINFKVLDLFSGCGGLALGFEARGFKTLGIEKNYDAVQTYKKNLSDCIEAELTIKTKFPHADVIIGGPPCQPFSVGGKQLGLKDSRDGFPIFIEAVEKLKPKLWLFENVRGMQFRNKLYLIEIIEKLKRLGYKVFSKILNAKEYGVPQSRERLFVIGSKNHFYFPEKNTKIFTVGDAISDIAFNLKRDDLFLTKSQDQYILKYEKASDCVNPRDLDFNKPARTLTCRNLSGATGDMQRIKLPDGRRKRLNVRESARLQSFPDWFSFSGKKNSQFNQIGNAVPPLLSYEIADSVLNSINNKKPVFKNQFQYEFNFDR